MRAKIRKTIMHLSLDELTNILKATYPASYCNTETYNGLSYFLSLPEQERLRIARDQVVDGIYFGKINL